MIIHKLVNEKVEIIKENLGTVNELYGCPNRYDIIDTMEESMRLYIKYLRDEVKYLNK